MSFQEEAMKAAKILENERILKVVIAAREEFIEQGIMNAKMKNIAKRAEVGEASVYRYFADKTELAKIVAFQYWNEMFFVFREVMTKADAKTSTSIDYIRSFLKLFIIIYKRYPRFLIFSEDFDGYMSFVMNEPGSFRFGSMMGDVTGRFDALIQQGIQKGEIRADLDISYVNSFISETLVSTTQKLANRPDYHLEDEFHYGEKCLTNLIEMFINYIKKDYANA